MGSTPIIWFLFADISSSLELVIYGRTCSLALADICSHLEMLGVAGVCIEVLPVVEGALQTDVKIGVARIWDVDADYFVAQDVYLAAEREQTIADDLCVL